MPLDADDLDSLAKLIDQKLQLQRQLIEQNLDTRVREQMDMQYQQAREKLFQQQLGSDVVEPGAKSRGAVVEAQEIAERQASERREAAQQSQPQQVQTVPAEQGEMNVSKAIVEAVKADPVAAISMLFDQAFDKFVKFKQLTSPHPFDQLLKLQQEHPELVSYFAPSPFNPVLPHLFGQAFGYGMQAKNIGQQYGMQVPPGGAPSTAPAAPVVPPSSSTGSSTGKSLVPTPSPSQPLFPGAPIAAPLPMGQRRINLARYARSL